MRGECWKGLCTSSSSPHAPQPPFMPPALISTSGVCLNLIPSRKPFLTTSGSTFHRQPFIKLFLPPIFLANSSYSPRQYKCHLREAFPDALPNRLDFTAIVFIPLTLKYSVPVPHSVLISLRQGASLAHLAHYHQHLNHDMQQRANKYFFNKLNSTKILAVK